MSLPALVEPAAELTIDEVRRYSRHLIIPDVGMTGQKRLKNAKVLVIGAGGLGSPALLYLAAAGVGTLGIAEFDEVDESNLQRQIIHGQSDIGKSEGGRPRRSRSPRPTRYVNVVVHDERLDNDNVLRIFEDYDLIVDGTDNFATRYMVNDAAYFLKKPYVWGSIYRFDGQASRVLADARGSDARRALLPLPLPRAAAAGHGALVRRGRRAGRAVRVSIGSIQVNEAIKLLTGIGDPLVGKLMIYDALEMEYRKLKVRKDPNCALCGENPTVTELIDYDAFCGAISEEAADAAAGSTISVDPARAHAQGARQRRARLRAGRRPRAQRVRDQQDPRLGADPQGRLPQRQRPRQFSCPRRQAGRAALQDRRPLGRGAGDRSRAPGTPTRCTSAAAWWPGSTRSTRPSRRTDAAVPARPARDAAPAGRDLADPSRRWPDDTVASGRAPHAHVLAIRRCAALGYRRRSPPRGLRRDGRTRRRPRRRGRRPPPRRSTPAR